jgi:hypothetical protein
MAEIVLLNGAVVHGGSSEVFGIIKGRDEFIKSYCKKKEWKEPLSIAQVLEIRAQEGWKHPETTEEA